MNYWKLFIICFTIIGLILWTSIFIFWFWLSYENIPCLVKNIKKNSEYDYIIVGSGTAGCVLANKLTSNENISVLLIEAGGNFGPLAKIPIATTLLQGTNVDWNLKTVSQKYSSRGLNDQQQSLPSGKGIGGSAQLNYMLHFNGIKKDFDKWESLGFWNYNDMKPYLNNIDDDSDDESFYCDTDDNLNHFSTANNKINNACNLKNKNNKFYETRNDHANFKDLSDSKIADILLESVDEFKQTYSDNVKVSLAQYNIKNGLRFSIYHEYLKPIFNRKNLHILLNTRVHKILFSNNNEAKSVLISNDRNFNEKTIITARKEIILSAGSIHTPQILKLSGIGPIKELEENNIPIIYNSPMVGKNYFDHLNMPIYISITEKESVTKDKILSIREWYKYLINGTGVMSNSAVVGNLRSITDDFGIIFFGMGSVDEKALKEIANFKENIFKTLFPFYFNSSKEGLILLSTCYQPKSRGEITLKHNHISMDPNINPNYLHEQADIQCLIKGIRLGVKIIQSNSFAILKPRIHWPKFYICSKYGPLSNDFLTNYPSDKYLECIIRTGALTSHHHLGTCAFGNTSNSVLDKNLRVLGVKKLRVVDGSVFPSPVSGYPNSIIAAVSKKAADIILNDLN